MMKPVTPQTPRLPHRLRPEKNPSKRSETPISVVAAGPKAQKAVPKCLELDFAVALPEDISLDSLDLIPTVEASAPAAATIGGSSEVTALSCLSSVSDPVDFASPASVSSVCKPEQLLPVTPASKEISSSDLLELEAQLTSDVLSVIKKEIGKKMELDVMSKEVMEAVIEIVLRNLEVKIISKEGSENQKLAVHKKLHIGINYVLLLGGLLSLLLAICSRLDGSLPTDHVPT